MLRRHAHRKNRREQTKRRQRTVLAAAASKPPADRLKAEMRNGDARGIMRKGGGKVK